MAIGSSMRFSLRILSKHWKLTSIAVFSLAIAMAAGTAGFSVFNALLLRPPAVAAPERLAAIYTSTPTEEFNGVSYDDYKYYRDNNQVFSDVYAFPNSISVRPIVYEHRVRQGLTNAASDNYFSVLGVQPFLGRVFARGEDDKPSALAVLSYSYWKWLGSDPGVIGKTVSVINTPLTIVGVMPERFVGTIFSDLPDVWYPLSMDAAITHQTQDWRADRTNQILGLVGRLKPGVTRQQAQADMQSLSKQLAADFPQTDKDRKAVLAEMSMLPPESVSSARIISAIILAVVALVLFAACSNVANLLLALANARRHEILVRAAMGATRARLVCELTLDSTLIALGGGAIGFSLAFLGLRQLTQFKPYIPGIGVLPLTIDFRSDLTVLALTGTLVILAGLALQGFGVGLFQVAYMDVVIATIPRHHRGVAGSVAMLTRTLNGMTLWEFIRTDDDPIVRAHVFEQARHAIERIHQGGLCHADLNLHNLFVTRAGESFTVVILDLDKARLRDRPVSGAARRRIAARLLRSAHKLDPRGRFLDSAALSILNFA